ncbi:pectin lyase fold/virulence factor [Tribonema minus]|uniref:Pectin lyase fold/virulence factor n=1 Tax=Tribonema minus TaxID=303371 RepID=A0A836CGE8_9STRA|nr:pectin lyase fold/virulence factor [Tribonema minus]
MSRTLSVKVLWALPALLMRAIAAPVAPACKAPPDIIDDHASAMKLTAAAACRDQTIKVKWRGFVGLTEPIIVAKGTSLDITGIGTDSEPAAISGQSKLQIMRVRNGASVTLQNLRLRDGFIELPAYAKYGGGAIRVAKGRQLSLKACQFWFNEDSGGAIYNDGDFTCGNSTFASNSADGGGAIYNYDGHFTCGNSTFTSNSADGEGGAISNIGNFTCGNSTFTSNTAYDGGAIFNYNGHFTCGNLTFTSNTADGEGGAIYNFDGDFTCGNSIFTSNTAANHGGAISNYGDFTSGNSTFTSNTAANDGGAISNDGKLICGNSTFAFNTAEAIKGGIVYGAARSELLMSTVGIWDSDSHEDGAIFSAGNVSISSSSFEHNSGGKGAGIYLAQDATAKIKDTSFLFNNASETGGALYLEATVTGHIDDCKFVNNSSPVGGALSLAQADDARNFNVRDCVFTNNTAAVGAGGAVIQQGTATALSVDVDKNTSFVNNVAQCCYDGVSTGGVDLPCVEASTGYGTGWRVTSVIAVDITSIIRLMPRSPLPPCPLCRSCCNRLQYLTVDANNQHICVTCDLPELNCDSIGLTVDTLPVASGFWRETFNQTDIRSCWNAGACLGNRKSLRDPTDIYCSEGYTGPCRLEWATW